MKKLKNQQYTFFVQVFLALLLLVSRTQQQKLNSAGSNIRKLLQQKIQGVTYTVFIDVQFSGCSGNCDPAAGQIIQTWASNSLKQIDNAVQFENLQNACAQTTCIPQGGFQYQVKFLGTNNTSTGISTYTQQLRNQQQNLAGQLQGQNAFQNKQLNINVNQAQNPATSTGNASRITGLSRGATIAVAVIVAVAGFALLSSIFLCLCCCFVKNKDKKNQGMHKKSKATNYDDIKKHQPQQGKTFFHKQMNKDDDTTNGAPIKTGSYGLGKQGNQNNTSDKIKSRDIDLDFSNGSKRNLNPNRDDLNLVNRSMSEDGNTILHTKSGTVKTQQSSTLSQIQSMLKDNFTGTVGFVTASTIDREKRNNLLKLEKYINRVYERDDGVFLEQYLLQGESFTKDGGSSRVYFAKVIDSEQEVAIKFFLQEEAFEREFSIYVDHPNLVGRATPSVREVGEGGNYLGQDGKRQWQPSYIVMDKGLDLRDWLRQRKPNLNLSLRTYYQVIKCVSYLHETRIAHNDIKPGNILWVPGLQAWRLIDYSVAAEFNEKRPIEFSLEYCAPEVLQAHEHRKGDIVSGPEVDIWSLGLLILELLTGHSILSRSTNEQEARNMLLGNQPLPHESDPTILDSLPDKLAGIALKMLNRYPEDRPTIFEVRKVVADLVERQSQLVLKKVVGIYPVSEIEEAFKDVNFGNKKGAAVAINVVMDELIFQKGKALQMIGVPVKKGSLLSESEVVYQLRAGFKYRVHFFLQYVDETRTYDLPIQNVNSILITPKDGKEIEQLPMVLQHNDIMWHGYIEWDPSTHQSEQMSSLTQNQKKLGGRAELLLDIQLQVPSGRDLKISLPLYVAINSQQQSLDNLRQHPAEMDTIGSVDAFKDGGVILAKLERQNESGHRQENGSNNQSFNQIQPEHNDQTTKNNHNTLDSIDAERKNSLESQ